MIPISFIRSSSYGSHEMCEMKYFGEYVLGWTGPPNKKADKGTIVHKVMEILANIKLARQNGYNHFEDEIAGEVFALELDNIFDKVYDHYTNQSSNHIWSPADYRETYKWLMKTISYNNGSMHPFNQEIVEPERHFDIEMKQDWAKYEYDINGEKITGNLRLKGTIDLITKIDNSTHEIIDYKTGKRVNWATGEEKTYEYLHKDFQLRLYHYAHNVLYPNIHNVLVTIFFINDGGAFTLAFGKNDIPETIDMIKDKFEYIKNTKQPKPNYTWKCKKFCHFGKQTFEDSNIKPLDAKINSKLSVIGEKMCMCDQIKYALDFRPIEDVISNMTKESHSISKYKAPGESE